MSEHCADNCLRCKITRNRESVRRELEILTAEASDEKIREAFHFVIEHDASFAREALESVVL